MTDDGRKTNNFSEQELSSAELSSVEALASLSDDLRRSLLLRSSAGKTAEIGAETLRKMQELVAGLRPYLDGAGSSAIQSTTDLPERIGRYRIIRLLGRGGFAVVYQARDVQLDRDVALKIPLPHRQLTEDARRRFLLEARAAARLDHPHIVATFEAGEAEAIPYIAYALCTGPTLALWLQNHGPLPPRTAARMLMQLAKAVSYSHQTGILHRDLKPANVLLFPQSNFTGADSIQAEFPYVPRLTDFGLAKVLESAAVETRTSVIMGTPNYMAPEQLEFGLRGCAPATDVFGLGAILYESLTGKPPHQGVSIIEILTSIRDGLIPPVRSLRPEVPVDLARICEKSLSQLPEDRYLVAEDLHDDLARFLAHESIHAVGPGLATRLIRAVRDPVRIREAAVFIMLSHAVILFWITMFPIGIGLGMAISHGFTLADLMPHTTPLWIFHSMSVVFGWFIGKKKIWAAIAATLTGGTFTLFILAVMIRWINPPYPSVYSDERTRDIVFMLLLGIFGTQTALSFCAWQALRALSQQKRGMLDG